MVLSCYGSRSFKLAFAVVELPAVFSPIVHLKHSTWSEEIWSTIFPAEGPWSSWAASTELVISLVVCFISMCTHNFPLRAYLKGTIQCWGFLSFGAGTVSFTIFTGLAIHSHITNNYKPVEKECNLSVQDRHKAVQLNRICKCFVKWEKKKYFSQVISLVVLS